jgi:hypothetical protein
MLRNFVLAKKALFYLLANNFLYNMETFFSQKYIWMFHLSILLLIS